MPEIMNQTKHIRIRTTPTGSSQAECDGSGGFIPHILSFILLLHFIMLGSEGHLNTAGFLNHEPRGKN